jgi:FSR family fosmidomycin resistance protein-like MFS transporter
MSFYITGGTLGFSLGPLLYAPFAERYGLEATPILLVPGLLVAVLLIRKVPTVPPEHDGPARGARALRPYALTLGLLYASVVLRTLAALSFSTFVPVMLTRRGMSVGEAGVVIAIYLVASGLSGLFGGTAADRFGPKTAIAVSALLATPFLVAAPLLSGWAFTLVLALGGFFVQATLPVNITYAQTVVPVSAATVSSLMMGFGWGTGGFVVPLVGFIADRIGIEPTLMMIALVPIGAAACMWPLPSAPTQRPPDVARAADVGIAEGV